MEEKTTEAVEPQAPAKEQDVTVDAPQDESQDAPTEQQQDAPVAPQPAVAEPEDEDDEPTLALPTVSPVPSLDLSKLPTDDEGNVTTEALQQAFQQYGQSLMDVTRQQAQQQYAEQLAETRAWDKATSKYPEIAKDPELHQMVQNIRIGELANSNGQTWLSPAAAADRLFKRFGTAKADGMRQATESVKVQQSAFVESGASRPVQVSKLQDNFSKIADRDPAVANKAQNDLLKELLFPSDKN